MQTNRQTPARGIVAALYRGKVVTWWRGGGAGQGRGRAGRGRSPRAHARAREAESWRKLAES